MTPAATLPPMDITAEEKPPERSPVLNREVRAFRGILGGRIRYGDRSRQLYSSYQSEYMTLGRKARELEAATGEGT